MSEGIILFLLVAILLIAVGYIALNIEKPSYKIKDWSWKSLPLFNNLEILYQGAITEVKIKDNQLIIEADGKTIVLVNLEIIKRER